tara:strand:+ start:19800 stop:20390 length:591 start_codon:yes stop_codon:yes gene_type:complete
MEQPVDVPLSFLKNLEKSKAVMNMTESVSNSSPKQTTTQGFVEDNQTEYLSELPQGVTEGYANTSRSTEPRPISNDMIQNSKLPDSIKKIMSENIIESPDMFVSENTPDLSKVRMDLMGGEKDVQYSKPSSLNELMQNKKKSIPTGQPIANTNEDMIRGVVRDELLKIMSETYTKKIKEDTIKKTIMTLKKQGLLK